MAPQNVPDSLIPHKTFTGNRPSTSILLPQCNAYTVGQLLSLYENRIAVQARIILICALRRCSCQAEAALCERPLPSMLHACCRCRHPWGKCLLATGLPWGCP